ncbi:MAG: endopeptidase La [Candidatus Cloacimonetes bacterium]|nr:endopeptidase La [Candidatus Cloacimonadota bacterium]MBS3766555.1 endopeptidase La [Candidatus Cloacimonadota bacterium]
MKQEIKQENILPVIPARNVVIFPNMVAPLIIGRSRSIKAVNIANESDKIIFCVAQKSIDTEKPTEEDIYKVGTVCEIIQYLKMPDGSIRVLINGLYRAKISQLAESEDYIGAELAPYESNTLPDNEENQALMKTLESEFKKYADLSRNFSEEALIKYSNLDSMVEKIDLIASNIELDLPKKQEVLQLQPVERLLKLIEYISKEVEILKIRQKIAGEVKSKLTKSQKEYFLNQEMKAIQEELGISKEDSGELGEIKKKLDDLELTDEARKKADQEIKRLQRTNPVSPEYSVALNYLNWLEELPWGKTKNHKDFKIEEAEKILDEDHYGLKKIKERIVEYLAVLKIVNNVKGQILCFVGPPGVGKTSLGRSIARAMDRKFERLSLGGVRDEAEIRGHRKTYIGAMPGIIIRSMKKAGTKNPVIMMDEIDKMSSDFRGDPSAALLEVLDPEQNFEFHDHYMEIPYDLSEVLFITTANTLYSIPSPLRDRMEIITLPGYTEYEKEKIAKGFLIPKQMKNHGLKDKLQINFSDNAIFKIIRNYTKEAGVRELERNISAVLRKIIRRYLKNKDKKSFTVSTRSVAKYLGVEKYRESKAKKESKIGVAKGLAWSSSGGVLLEIEALLMEGKGKVHLTGKLGDVMKESANAALSYSRSNYKEFDIEKNFYKNKDVHIHVPQGAIPKDGPSAGITIAVAIISALSKRKVSGKYAMTGEITLMGNVLPVGGLEEKLVAAKRSNIPNVIIPKKNEKDLVEIDKQIKKGLNIIPVESMKEVIDIALE